MKLKTSIHLLSICSLLFFIATESSAEQKVRIRLDLPKSGIEANQLPQNLDIAGVNSQKGALDFIGSKEYLELLKEQGYPVTALELQPMSLDQRYLNPEEIVSLTSILADDYPDITEIKVIGHTWQNRPIVALKISNKFNTNPKPSILFNGMHHAREIMTTEVTSDIMIYLTHHYNNPDTPWVQDWVDNLEIWVVPQVNPDGNSIVWSKDTWWRKNAKGNDRTTWGVDLNRNYPYEWGQCRGSSGSKGSQTYRGDTPGSEPETQALMNLVKAINPVINISYHSYSELVLAPYGCQGDYTPENFIFHDVGMNLAKKLVKDSGTGTYEYGTGWEILYPVDGEDMSWMYNEMNVLAYVIEVNSSSQGFHPDYEKWRNVTVKNQRPGWQYLLNRTLYGPQVRGSIVNANTGAAINGSVLIHGVSYSNESPRKTSQGFFSKALKPGEYELVFQAEGFHPKTIGVSVDQEPLSLLVDLDPLIVP